MRPAFQSRLLLPVTLATAIALACGGGGGDAGGDGESSGAPIKIGAIFDLTGVTSDVGTTYAEGLRAYVEWLNSRGGLENRQIDLVFQDYGYKVDLAEQLYSQFVQEGVVAFMGWGTGDTEALRGRITADRVPFMSASYAETLTTPSETPFNFVVATSYSDQMRLALQWISEEAASAQVASFHHDSPFGESPQEAGAEKAKELGIGFKTYAMPAEHRRAGSGHEDRVPELVR
jgi:branched-chain amino acid transport system substrate-binding protein